MGSLRVRKPGESLRWGIGSDLRGKEWAMDASEAASRQVGDDDAITTRMGAVALPLGIDICLYCGPS